MRELKSSEMELVTGGVVWIPIAIAVGKGMVAGFGVGATAWGLYYMYSK